MPSSFVMKAYSWFQQLLCAFQLEHMLLLLGSICPVGYEYEQLNMGKYLSCRSMGNTMGK